VSDAELLGVFRGALACPLVGQLFVAGLLGAQDDLFARGLAFSLAIHLETHERHFN